MSNHQELKSSILGGVLSLSWNLFFLGDIAKALLLGMVGAFGGWLMNQIIKKFSK